MKQEYEKPSLELFEFEYEVQAEGGSAQAEKDVSWWFL